MTKLQRITDDVFLLSGDGHPKICSNVYILEGPESLALIDSGVDAPRLQTALKAFTKPMETVFFTHGHFDHVQAAIKAGWKGLAAKEDLDIISELNAAWVKVKKPDFFKAFEVSKETSQKIQNGNKNKKEFTPIRLAGFQLRIIPTPGHTPGSVSFLDEKRGILFSGDCKFAQGGVGRTDFWGGSAAELEKSLALIDRLDYRILAPGHGPLESRTGL